MTRRRLITILLSLAAFATVAGTALAAGRIVTTVSVRASLSNAGNPRKARLDITRDGQSFYSAPVRSRFCSECSVAPLVPHKSPLLEADLESANEPDVILGLYSGGAHCCFIDQVFSYDPGAQTYVKVEHDFLDAGAAIGSLRQFLQDFRLREMVDYLEALRDHEH